MSNPTATSSPPRIERLPAVLARTGLGRSSLYAAIARGEFVRPVKLTGGRAIGFLAAEVDDWIAARAAERPSMARPPGAPAR